MYRRQNQPGTFACEVGVMFDCFKSIDRRLSDIGWKRFYENKNGFRYVKKVGIDVFFYADQIKEGIFFYDDNVYMRTIPVDETELKLFRIKIKEWRRQYGYNPQNRTNDG